MGPSWRFFDPFCVEKRNFFIRVLLWGCRVFDCGEKL